MVQRFGQCFGIWRGGCIFLRLVGRLGLMRLDLGLRLHVDHRALGVRALLAPRHGDVRPLQVVQRQRVRRLVAQVGADLV